MATNPLAGLAMIAQAEAQAGHESTAQDLLYGVMLGLAFEAEVRNITASAGIEMAGHSLEAHPVIVTETDRRNWEIALHEHLEAS